MKKTSLILAISALLYGTSSTSVLADNDIYPGMTNAEIEAVLDANCPKPIDVPADATDPEDVVGDAAILQPPLPGNISVDDSEPQFANSFCGISPTGAQMANFPVSVNGGTPIDFEQLGPTSGIAIGAGWLLYQAGNTWTKRWCLVTETPIDDIEITPFSKKGKIKYAFDIIYLPTHSDEPVGGSAKGWAITDGPVGFTATYSWPVYVGDHIPDSPHDMYGKLKVEFDEPLVGSAGFENFVFRADTDCLPDNEIKNIVHQGGKVTFDVTAADESARIYIVETCEGNSKSVAGPFDVGTISTKLTLNSGCSYKVIDEDENAFKLEGLGGTSYQHE
jgi:hypothetical protein